MLSTNNSSNLARSLEFVWHRPLRNTCDIAHVMHIGQCYFTTCSLSSHCSIHYKAKQYKIHLSLSIHYNRGIHSRQQSAQVIHCSLPCCKKRMPQTSKFSILRCASTVQALIDMLSDVAQSHFQMHRYSLYQS